MKRTASYLTAILTLAATAAAPGAEKHRGFAPPLKGVVTHGRTLACIDEPPGFVYFCQASLAGGKAGKRINCTFNWTPPSVWQVGKGFFWVSSTMDLPGHSPPNAVQDKLECFRLDDLVKGELIQGPPGAEKNPFIFAESRGVPDPLDSARWLSLDLEYPFRLFFDYLPTAEDEVLLFQLCNVAGADRPDKDLSTLSEKEKEEFKSPHWSLTVFRHKYKVEWDAKEKHWIGTWERVEKIEVGFRERFRLVGQGDDYYFVTASGKLYRAPKPDKGKDRKMETVWDDKKRPIVSFITDADADRTFLFCKPDKDGKGVYFEMSDKPDPQPYDAAKIPEAKPEDPLPAVLAYAKLLVADKKIKAKE
jgi:hypothetical protein